MAGLKSYSSNGMWANVYVPENVNANTDVFVFVHGGGTGAEDRNNDWNSVINYQLNQNGSDSIIVMPTMGSRYDENWASNTMDIVENIQEEYGITNMNVTSSGFSNGGWGATRTTIENIKRNADLEPQVLFLLDDYGINTQNPSVNMFGDGGQEAFLQNDSIIFSYVNKISANPNTVSDKTRQLDTMAESGANLIRVVCDNGGHQDIKNNFFRNGLADYTNGTATLPTEGYTYQKANLTVDPTTGEKTVTWEDVDVNDINTKEKLYNYFGVKSSINESKIAPLKDLTTVSERNVFVDLASLQNWSSQLNNINEESISQLAMMLSTVNSLEDSWEGNFAKGFIDDCSKLIKDSQNIHNKMKDVAYELIEVSNVESNL